MGRCRQGSRPLSRGARTSRPVLRALQRQLILLCAQQSRSCTPRRSQTSRHPVMVVMEIRSVCVWFPVRGPCSQGWDVRALAVGSSSRGGWGSVGSRCRDGAVICRVSRWPARQREGVHRELKGAVCQCWSPGAWQAPKTPTQHRGCCCCHLFCGFLAIVPFCVCRGTVGQLGGQERGSGRWAWPWGAWADELPRLTGTARPLRYGNLSPPVWRGEAVGCVCGGLQPPHK